MNRAPDLIAELRAEIQAAPTADLPSIRGQLAALQAEVLVRLTTPQMKDVPSDANGEDRVIDVSAAAQKLGMSERYMYEHAEEYGGAKWGGCLRFSNRRINAMIKRRSYGY